MVSQTFDRANSVFDIEINQDENFDLPIQLKQLNADGSETAFDLTVGGAVADPLLEMYIRPSFDHSTLIKKMTTPIGGIGGIILDTASEGKISFYMVQASVETLLPVSGRYFWQYFLRFVVGADITELMRGSFIVNPGRDT